MRIPHASFVPALLAVLVASPDALAKKPEKGEAYLVRPAGEPDPDAKGRIRVEQKGEKEEIRFDAKKLDPGASFELHLEDAVGAGTFTLFGTLEQDDDPGDADEYSLRVRSEDGPLPLGASSVDDYAGRIAEVRLAGAGTVVLNGIVPLAQKLKGKKGFEKEKDGLVLPLAPPDPNAKGRVEVWNKIKDGRQRFRVRIERVAAGDTYGLFVEDGPSSGNYVSVAALKKDSGKGENAEFKLHLDSKNGDPMPLGELEVEDLGGRGLQVRDGLGQVILEGSVPDLD